VTLAGGVLGTAFFTEAASAVVAEAMIVITIQTASHVLSRNRAGVVSAEVATLTKQVRTTKLLTKLKMTATVLLTIGTLMAGAGVLARQETAPSRQGHVEPEVLTSPLATYPDYTPATLDRVARDFDAVAEQFTRQIRGTVAVLGRESSPDKGKLAVHFRDQLKQVESEIRGAQERLAGWLGPAPANSPPAKAGKDNNPNLSPEGPDAHQPTLRAGGYIFTGSPTGNKAIAYDPITREMKSVQLNATKEHPIKITPMTGDHVQLVTLRLQGSRITRIAVFDLKSGRWLPMDLDEPVNGIVDPEYVGHGGTAFDLGRHVYTFNLKTGTWDHLDIRSISDEGKDEGAAKVPAAGKASK
jgi:hypothetical protein